jgi:fatty acid-binding protein 3, muscle and heart
MAEAAFLGDWKLQTSENFEALMKELGVGMILRKIGATTKPNVKFSINGDEWTFSTISTIKTSTIKFTLNQEFDEETIDGRKVKTIFTLDNGRLVQTQKNEKGEVVCVITREITDNGELKVVATAGQVESIRTYTKQ